MSQDMLSSLCVLLVETQLSRKATHKVPRHLVCGFVKASEKRQLGCGPQNWIIVVLAQRGWDNILVDSEVTTSSSAKLSESTTICPLQCVSWGFLEILARRIIDTKGT